VYAKKSLFAILLAGLILSSPALADKAILILDASGSMWEQIDGKAKFQIAQEVVGDLLKDWPASTELGIVAYGHREKASCRDIESLIPVGPVNATAIKAAIGDINPKGKTPLTDAVRFAARELRSTEEKATVILVSDGLETCNADPCAAAAELHRTGVDFTIHVVGFGTKREENRQLQCLADNSGGRFLGAGTAAELKKAMTTTVELVAKPTETKKTLKVNANIGGLRIINTAANQLIYDAAGELVKIKSYDAAPGTRINLPPGTYSLREGGVVTVPQFQVKAGEETVVDFNKHVGVLRIINTTANQLIYDSGGKQVALKSYDALPGTRINLPPGVYSLREGGVVTVEQIEIKAGEETVVDFGR
jgi:mRNA-degrading endonuclease toxin of MazEF toxin-antitoxin module